MPQYRSLFIASTSFVANNFLHLRFTGDLQTQEILTSLCIQVEM